MTVAPTPHKQTADTPLVSLVMPVRNEAAHLDRALSAVDAQSYPASRMEIIVVDGGSTDGTLELVHEWMARDERIRLLGGPDVNTPLAMNIGLDASKGEVVAKIDGHGWVNTDFIEIAIKHLAANNFVGCIGGRIIPVVETDSERAISYARFSVLGVGGGIYTAPERVHSADTVQCGVYRRSALAGVGGFDAGLAYGEDEELNFRLRMAGWTIVYHPKMQFNYHVRSTIVSLFRQYVRYGRARVAVIRKHPQFFRVKHAVPAALMVALCVGAVLVALDAWRLLGVLMLASYAALIVVGSAWLAFKNRFHRPDLIAGSLLALHLGYGLGSMAGVYDTVRGDEGPAPDGSPNSGR